MSSTKHEDKLAQQDSLTLRKASKLVNCGLASGLAQAVLFNPWDRALYLSVKDARPFLTWINFKDPFAGVLQTVVQRTISAGLYFPLEEIFSFVIKSQHVFPEDSKNKALVVFLAGTLAGIVNGVIMNPFTRIKYQYWGLSSSANTNFFKVAYNIISSGGFRHLFVGTLATVNRDLIFGGCFALMRHELLPFMYSRYESKRRKGNCIGRIEQKTDKKKASFTINLISATTATILSSPVNYVRNIHYATSPADKPDTTIRILKDLLQNALKEPTFIRKWHYIQSRLRLGWGTARVGCGMAFGAKIYDLCSSATRSGS